MTVSTYVNRLENIRISAVDADDEAQSYLREMQTSLQGNIESGSIVGLGNIFYTALTSELVGVGISSDFRLEAVGLVAELATDTGGYREMTTGMIEGVNKWSAEEAEPTALGTAYCILLSYLLDSDLPIDPVNTWGWWNRTRNSNGLFINEDWSDTQMSSRYPSEYFGEAFLTFVASGILRDEEGIDELPMDDTVEFIENIGLSNSKYLSAEYYKIRILEMASVSDLVNRDELEAHLANHQSEVDYGYQEYLLDEKSDEQSGSSSRTGRDSVDAHIFATVQATFLLDRFGSVSTTDLRSCLQETLTEAHRVGGGFGFPVTIREYEPMYGPVSTPRETYYAIIGEAAFY